MHIELKYGAGTLPLNIPDTVQVDVLTPAALPVLDDPATELAQAFDRWATDSGLDNRPTPASVAVAVPDETRPVPVATLFPVVLAKLREYFPELSPSDVTVVVGGGLHPPADKEQLERILPRELAGGAHLVPHDAKGSPMRSFGTTSRGTPVMLNAFFAEAELKIVLGMIDPHQFVGFTGGSKGAIVGCGSAETIRANHSLMFDPQAVAGSLPNNPVRQDLSEAGDMVGIDLAVNVVLNSAKQVVHLDCGAPREVLERGAATCARLNGVAVSEPYDIVVASSGGHPKDICLYQAQKGLAAAAQAARPGGHILLVAACTHGVGDEDYYDYACRFDTAREALQDFTSKPFRMGAHKAFLFSRVLTRFDMVLHSELDAQTLQRCHIAKGDAQATLDAWLSDASGSGQKVRLAVIPAANATYFYRDPDARRDLSHDRPRAAQTCVKEQQ